MRRDRRSFVSNSRIPQVIQEKVCTSQAVPEMHTGTSNAAQYSVQVCAAGNI